MTIIEENLRKILESFKKHFENLWENFKINIEIFEKTLGKCCEHCTLLYIKTLKKLLV